MNSAKVNYVFFIQKPWHTEFIVEEEIKVIFFHHHEGTSISTQLNVRKLHYQRGLALMQIQEREH